MSIIGSRKFVWSIVLGFVLSVCLACQVGNPNQATSVVDVAQNLYLPAHQDFRIAVISDLNSQYGSTEYEPEVKQAIALMPQWQPDLVLSGGDAIAGQKKSLTKSQIEAMWQAFDLYIAQPLRQQNIPFAFTIGNHDGSGAIKNNSLVFPLERELAQKYWQEQESQLGLNFIEKGNFPFYYTFQQDEIFFLVWDASTHLISDEQLAWVKQALNSDRAQQAKLRIAIGHLPLYPVAKAKNKPGEYLARGEELRSLLEQNQVEVYISGHHHVYYPGKKGKLELLHAGALGQGARQLIDSELPPFPTVTIVDFKLDASEFTYTTYNAKTWEIIAIEQLPSKITGDFGTILRRDL
ncbi:MAG: metallophosphoesterase [Cyanobacteria bacterium P01_G01_bin.19]